MFSHYRLYLMALSMFVLASLSLSACASAPTLQPTDLPNPTDTAIPFTETPTLRPTRTAKPMQTIKPTKTIVPGEMELYKAATLISSLENASRNEIVETLLRKWLEYFKTDLVSEHIRLKDYRIEKVNAQNGYCPTPDKNTTKFIAEVQFSIQTVIPFSDNWVAGGGNLTLTSDHWVYHKSGFASISASNGVYTLGWEGIPPCSGS